MLSYRFSVKEIEEDPTVQNMLDRRTLSVQTRRNYVKAIRFFCEYYRSKPKELISRFKSFDADRIVDEFSNFFVWSKDKVASKSLLGWLPGIRAWLVENGVREVDRVGREIAREFRRRFGSAKPLLRRDVVTKEEIIRILKIAPLRERAIITTMASGGFRLHACLNLQIKHFRDDIMDSSLPCYCLEIPETLSKEGEPYLTFISAEAGEYIRTFLIHREENGEEINSETYLFTAYRKNTPLSDHRFENIWRKLCEDAGLDLRPVPIKGFHPVGKKGGGVELRRGGYRYNTRIHSLRKFFKTACSISGVDRMASEAFLGHSLTKFGVESLYDFCISNLEWLREEYMKVLPNVTFLKKLPTLPIVNGEARKRIEELEKAYKELEREYKELKEEVSYILTVGKLLEIAGGDFAKVRELLEELLKRSK